jgi:hypothetical protein
MPTMLNISLGIRIRRTVVRCSPKSHDLVVDLLVERETIGSTTFKNQNGDGSVVRNECELYVHPK